MSGDPCQGPDLKHPDADSDEIAALRIERPISKFDTLLALMLLLSGAVPFLTSLIVHPNTLKELVPMVLYRKKTGNHLSSCFIQLKIYPIVYILKPVSSEHQSD